MPRRSRSWIKRSSSAGAAALSPAIASRRLLAAGFPPAVCRAAFDLATVPPCNPGPEPDVQPSKAEGHQTVTPGHRREKRDGAQNHETGSHHGNHTNRQGSTGYHGGAVEEQPERGKQSSEPGPVKGEGEKAT